MESIGYYKSCGLKKQNLISIKTARKEQIL